MHSSTQKCKIESFVEDQKRKENFWKYVNILSKIE